MVDATGRELVGPGDALVLESSCQSRMHPRHH
jgi:hypothetical protein